jgi:hypothetical protein
MTQTILPIEKNNAELSPANDSIFTKKSSIGSLHNIVAKQRARHGSVLEIRSPQDSLRSMGSRELRRQSLYTP